MLRLADRLTEAKDGVGHRVRRRHRTHAGAGGRRRRHREPVARPRERGRPRASRRLARHQPARHEPRRAERRPRCTAPDRGAAPGTGRVRPLAARRARCPVATRPASSSSTVHRVKGQEWPHVIVHMAQPDLFPHRLADDDEEERRLFHVAITRAVRHVTIVTGGDPSPFVAELTSEPPAHRPSERPSPVLVTRTAAKQVAAVEHPLLDRESRDGGRGSGARRPGSGVDDHRPRACRRTRVVRRRAPPLRARREGRDRRTPAWRITSALGRRRRGQRPAVRPARARSAIESATIDRRTRCSTTRRWLRSPPRCPTTSPSSQPCAASERSNSSSTATTSSTHSRRTSRGVGLVPRLSRLPALDHHFEDTLRASNPY